MQKQEEEELRFKREEIKWSKNLTHDNWNQPSEPEFSHAPTARLFPSVQRKRSKLTLFVHFLLQP
jgi:hypothetical protein